MIVCCCDSITYNKTRHVIFYGGCSYDKFCPFYKSVWMMKNIMHFGALANQVYPYLVHLLFSFGSSHLVQVTCKPNGGNTVIYVQVLCWTSCSFRDVLHFITHLPLLPQSIGDMHGTMQML
jgi:hypothetical protein